MSDSETTLPSEPQKKPAVTEELIVRPTGTVKLHRGKGGKFVKPQTPESLAREVLRNFMNSTDIGVTGKRSKQRLLQHYEKMHQIMMEDYHSPVFDKLGNQIGTIVDAKIMSAQVAAFVAIQDRLVGKPSKSSEDREATKISSITTVIGLQGLENMINKEIIPEPVKKTLTPSAEFIEGEWKEVKREK
jgi:hypothetical protein